MVSALKFYMDDSNNPTAAADSMDQIDRKQTAVFNTLIDKRNINKAEVHRSVGELRDYMRSNSLGKVFLPAKSGSGDREGIGLIHKFAGKMASAITKADNNIDLRVADINMIWSKALTFLYRISDHLKSMKDLPDEKQPKQGIETLERMQKGAVNALATYYSKLAEGLRDFAIAA